MNFKIVTPVSTLYYISFMRLLWKCLLPTKSLYDEDVHHAAESTARKHGAAGYTEEYLPTNFNIKRESI